MINQHSQQLARDKIDHHLISTHWIIQHKRKINLSTGKGRAVREYHTNVVPAIP